MTAPRKRSRALRRIALLGTVAGAIFGYRHYRLANAPEPSWDKPA